MIDIAGSMRSVSSQAKGIKSTPFLTHVRKERSRLSTVALRRCAFMGLWKDTWPTVCFYIRPHTDSRNDLMRVLCLLLFNAQRGFTYLSSLA